MSEKSEYVSWPFREPIKLDLTDEQMEALGFVKIKVPLYKMSDFKEPHILRDDLPTWADWIKDMSDKTKLQRDE